MSDPYISEVKYFGSANQDFVEVVVDAGMDVSNIVVTVYHANGNVRSENALETLATTISGKDIYLITKVESSTFSGLHKFGGVSLSDESEVYQFVSFDDGAPILADEGAASGLTSVQIGQAGAGTSLESLDGGETYHHQLAPNDGIIPCFVAGTRILTPNGEICVEDLCVGDLVCVPSGAPRRVCAVMTRHVEPEEALRCPGLSPVCFGAGSLAEGVPRRDLYLSRQHRVLVQSAIVRRMFDLPGVLVAAHRLESAPGVQTVSVRSTVTYVHLLLDRHAVILAEGAPCESFLIAPISMQGLDNSAWEAVVAAFPEAACPNHMALPCALIPDRKRQSRLIERHLGNRKPFVSGGYGCSKPEVG